MAEVAKSQFLGLDGPTEWGDLATIIGSMASSIAAVIAIMAAFYARSQIKQAKIIQRESGAHQAYLAYLQMAFANPKFSSGYKGKSPEEFEQYEWYISYLLDMGEQVLEMSEYIETWTNVMQLQISYHSDYFRNNKNFKESYKKHYSKTMIKLIDAEVANVR
ncbi:hypothetical protein [Methylorubrum sp. SB2]|uniref:hypothetical protein n=1 Tax=Methylorubrum subtropicum TaxID=3138812 RepID=UPI00313C362B